MTHKRHKRPRYAAVFIAVVIAAAVLIKLPEAEKLFIYPEKFNEYVEKYAKENGLDKYFVYAVIKTESNFDPLARSDAGAIGLMQIMEDSFEWVRMRMGEDECNIRYEDLYDPKTNIRYGTYLLRLLFEEFGSGETAAAAYHAGRGNVNSWLSDKSLSRDGITLDDIPSSVTGHYVHKVMTAYEGYTNLYKKA